MPDPELSDDMMYEVEIVRALRYGALSLRPGLKTKMRGALIKEIMAKYPGVIGKIIPAAA